MILFFIIAVLSFVVQLFLPWWSMIIVAFGAAFFAGRKAGSSFLGGMLGCGIVWLLMSIFISVTKGDLMNGKIAELLQLPSPFLLFLVSFLIAGIIGGVAALSGFFLRAIVFPRSENQNLSI